MAADEILSIDRLVGIFGDQRQRHRMVVIHREQAWKAVDELEAVAQSVNQVKSSV